MPHLPTGSRLITTTAGTQTSPERAASSLSSSGSSVTSAALPFSAHCTPTLTSAYPPLYSVYPPYIVMGFSVQPVAYPPPQTGTGSRKRKQLPASAKRRHRKQQNQHGDVVSSTTPDSCQLETTSSCHAFLLPAEMTSSATDEAEVTSPLCLSVRREKLVYDSCGALDLTIHNEQY